MKARIIAVQLAACVIAPALLWAHQPVMDMAPRWKRGWGAEIRNEYRGSDGVKDGDAKVDNPLGRDRWVNTTWIEGVYAFVPQVRLTAKIPWVRQRRVIVRNGAAVRQSGSGFGDLILGAPLKRLIVGPGTLADVTLTPSLRVPTGDTSDDFPVGDGSTDFGLSLTYKRDIAWFYQYYDLFYWANGRGKKSLNTNKDGDEIGFDMNLGLLPYHDMRTNTGVWVMWDLQARYQDRGVDADGTTGTIRLSTGPMVMWYKDNLMLHVQYTVPAYEWFNGSQVSYGQEVTVGMGITF